MVDPSPEMQDAAAAVRELAPLGRVRAAINLGNPVLAQREASTGELRGASVALANELAGRLGTPLELVGFDAAGKVFEALKSAAWDVAFLAIDPVRASEIDFTAPYVLIEGTYIVRTESPLRAAADFDRPGVRIAVGRGAAYDLFLSRSLRHAELVRCDTSSEALSRFLSLDLEAAAGVRQPLAAFARDHAGLRVIEEPFVQIRQAMGVPKGRAAALRYVGAFIEEMKASGFVAAALARSGQAATVAPAAARD